MFLRGSGTCSLPHRAEAVKLLRKRHAEMGSGRLIGPDAERTTFEDLAAGLESNYEVNERRSLGRARTADDRRAMLRHLPEPLRPVMEFAYLTGWRKQEILTLTWAQVDFGAGVVRLEPGTTKNRQGRTFPFRALPQLEALLKAQRERTTAVERAQQCIVSHVFHRTGNPTNSYDGAWRIARKKAGLPGHIVHDFRRSAARNLVRAGVPERVAMMLTGHLTRAVFDRYAIVSERDLSEGVAKLAALPTSWTERGQSAVSQG